MHDIAPATFPLVEQPDHPDSIARLTVDDVTIRFHQHGPLATLVPTTRALRYGLPSLFEATINDPNLSVIVRMEIAATTPPFRAEVHSLVCTRRSTSTEVTGSELRRIPVARLKKNAVDAAVLYVQRRADGTLEFYPRADMLVEHGIGPSGGWSLDEFESDYQPSRWMITPEFLAEVADVYRKAAEVGDPATQAVADHFGRSRSAAGRWISICRTAEFGGPYLGPAIGTRAGEAEAPKRRKS